MMASTCHMQNLHWVDAMTICFGPKTPSLACCCQHHAGKHLLLKVQKRVGKESELLLPAADAPVVAKKKQYDTINVFTVASGHMYERLQKIMILSVIKNTKAK